MTHDRDFKRLVRHRMRKTGESYASARAHLWREHATGRAASERSGEAAMYPFERFTEPARRALTRAQVEAEVGNSRSIATTHLLLGLFHDKNTMAVGTLGRLEPGLLRRLLNDQTKIRRAIERQPAEGPVPGSEGLVPSEQVKRAIELAFAEARVIGDGSVGTGHLLVGVLRVETSSGARVMAEMGVTVDEARAKLRELTGSGLVPESSMSPGGLRNELAYVTGFVGTVHDVLKRFERETGTQSTLLVDDGWPSRIVVTTANDLLLFLEGALRNIREHPGARSVNIRLVRAGDDAVLTLQDGGRGISGSPDDQRYGITDVLLDAVPAGWGCSVEGAPDGGTTLTVSVPVRTSPWTVMA